MSRSRRGLGLFGRGRKNWLFAGSDAGGEWLAVLHTVVRTCQRLSIAPFECLTWVLTRLSDPPVNRGKGTRASLTPMAYAEATRRKTIALPSGMARSGALRQVKVDHPNL